MRSILTAFLCFACGCVFAPSRYVCSSGETSDGKTCQSGVWVDDSTDTGMDGCVPESNEDFCLGFCAERTGDDNCGQSRTVICPDNCNAFDSMCGAGGIPNACGCDGVDDTAACEQIECGETSLPACVEGADDRILDCGECTIENSRCLVNACVCNDGWVRNGDTCDDIDECQNDPCGPEQTCNNLDGTFECVCDIGFTANGLNCDADPLALTVYTESAQVIADTNSIDITNLFNDNANVVPFVSANSDANTGSLLENTAIDVSINGNSVQLSRFGTGGIVEVTVALVEFDPALVKVQSGTFFMDDGDRNVEVSIEDVDLSRAFVVFYNKSARSDYDRRDGFILADLDPSRIEFDREDNEDQIEGSWWVVEALHEGFSVHDDQRNLDDAAEDFPVDPAIDPAKTFLLYSYQSTDSGASQGHWSCRILDGMTVPCERAVGGNSANARIQLITLNGRETVTRGTETIDDAIVSFQVLQDPAKSIPLIGQLSNAGAVFGTAVDANATWSSYVRAAYINQGVSMVLKRGGTDESVTASWQTVQWIP